MGISADLILFCKDSEDEIYDYDQEDTLYDFLPKELHYLIEELDVELIKIPENDPIEVEYYNEQGQVFQLKSGRKILEKDQETYFVKSNKISFRVLKYLGGKRSFIEGIYGLYYEKRSFNWLFPFSSIDQIYKFSCGTINRKELHDFIIESKLSESHLFINLNY